MIQLAGIAVKMGATKEDFRPYSGSTSDNVRRNRHHEGADTDNLTKRAALTA